MTIEQIVSVVRDPRNTKNQKYTLFELLLIVIASTITPSVRIDVASPN